jgi:hypothetical protein
MSINLEKPRANKPTQWVQLSVVILVLGIAAYFIISFLMKFILWILVVLAIPVIIINYKTILQAFHYIKNLYSKNLYLGLGATLGAVLLSTPFVGFLFVKTLWDFRNSDFIGKKQTLPAANNNIIDTDYTEVK